MLTKNTQRHDHRSVPSPPTTGPPAAAMPAMVAHQPMARRRSPGSLYSARTRANEDGTNIADAAPCAAVRKRAGRCGLPGADITPPCRLCDHSAGNYKLYRDQTLAFARALSVWRKSSGAAFWAVPSVEFSHGPAVNSVQRKSLK